MSVADEAKAAALETYPQGITAEGVAEWRRVPYAHGYQRGYEAGVSARDGVVSTSVVQAALSEMLEVATNREDLQAVRLSILKRRIVKLQHHITQRGRQ